CRACSSLLMARFHIGKVAIFAQTAASCQNGDAPRWFAPCSLRWHAYCSKKGKPPPKGKRDAHNDVQVPAMSATPAEMHAPQRLAQDGRGAQLWRDRLDLLLESTGDGIFGVDMQGNCIFIN